MNQIREDYATLASAMRALIRAAGGFGPAVAVAAEEAERIAQLWYDGESCRMVAAMPAAIDAIRGRRGGGRKSNPPEQMQVTHAAAPVTEQAAADQPKAAYQLEAQCKGEVHAACHQDAVAAFVASIAQFITAIYIRSAQ